MIHLSVPATFDDDLVEEYARLNRRHAGRGIRVAEVYGALPGLGSARPADTLPAVGLDRLLAYAGRLAGHGIALRYTLNAPDLTAGNAVERLPALLECLSAAGVRALSVSSPDVILWLSKAYPGRFDVAASTILQADSLPRIRQLLDLGASQVVLDIRANRDFALLDQVGRRRDALGRHLVMMVNEFCGDCALRFQHYLLQSAPPAPEPPEVAGYPFAQCIDWFMGSPAAVLKGYWVLPQWLGLYRDMAGLRWFKIAGRTVRSAHWHRTVVGAYMAGGFDGPLLALEPSDDVDYPFALSCAEIDASGYLEHFISRRPHCASQCQVSCRFCDALAERLAAPCPV